MKTTSHFLLLLAFITILSCSSKPTPPPITKTEMESLFNAGEVKALIVEDNQLFINRTDSDLKIPVMLSTDQDAELYARQLLRNATMINSGIKLITAPRDSINTEALSWLLLLAFLITSVVLSAVATTKVINGSNIFGDKVLWFIVIFFIPIIGPIAALIGRKR